MARLMLIQLMKSMFQPLCQDCLRRYLTVTNTYQSPKIEITGTKAWVNGPTLTHVELQLYRDGATLAIR